LIIYDITGREVKRFSSSEIRTKTPSHVQWDGRSDSEKLLPNGVYVLKCVIGDHVESKKLILVR
jgi:flagellar hook assembly protein FlgD